MALLLLWFAILVSLCRHLQEVNYTLQIERSSNFSCNPNVSRAHIEVSRLLHAIMSTRLTAGVLRCSQQISTASTDLSLRRSGRSGGLRPDSRFEVSLWVSIDRIVVTLAMSSHLHTECQLICEGCCQQTRFHALRTARTAQALTAFCRPQSQALTRRAWTHS